MSKLLSAGFMRLRKNKLFWVGVGFMLAFGLLLTGTQYRNQNEYGIAVLLDSIIFGYAIPIGIVMSVFCSMFTGTEYSDGTIRNKLTVGHSRINIYLSNLIINIIASLFMCISCLMAVIAAGIPLFGFIKSDAKTVLLMLLGTFAMCVAFCSVFTLIGMLCGSKAASAVICILGAVLLLFFSVMVSSRLKAPEFYDDYVFTGPNGTFMSENIPNPEYLRGAERAVYEFIDDFLPTGQALKYSDMSAVHLMRMPLYSLIITVVAAVAGCLAFKRKDIK